MKITIIGMGAVASVMSHFLTQEKSVHEITVASNNLKRDKEFIAKHHKIKLARADASNISDVAKVAKGSDLVVNASLPDFNMKIMEACLKINANYMDLASLNERDYPEQLKFDKRFQKQKLVGLFDTGISPGVSNILAMQAAEQLDSVTSIKIISLEDQQTSELVSSWSKEHCINTLASRPLAYLNGKYVYRDFFGDVEEYQLPMQFGKRFLYNTYGDEVPTLPRYLKVRNVVYKGCGSDVEAANMFYRCGLLGKKPISVDNKKIVPMHLLTQILPDVPTPRKMIELMKKGAVENGVYVCVIETVGKKFGKNVKIRTTARYPDLKEISKKFPGATYISYPTGMAAASFAKIIPKIKEYGVFPPEALASELRKQVLIDLENKAFVLDEEFRKA